MEAFVLCVHLLAGLCARSSFAFPHRQHALSLSSGPGEHSAPAAEPGKLHAVRVACRPDALEVGIKADMFGVGAPVDKDELRLGVEDNDECRATAASGDEYRIIVGLMDCGTKHWMTKDSLVYTNLLIFSPVASPYGLIRMDEAVVPIECHYERHYSLSSSSLKPAWIPFASTQAAVESLRFDLTIMTADWLYKRSSNVFFLGESISIEASVRVGHHVGLRVFMSNCVATLNPDVHSVPRYAFIQNGCLTDSQVPGSRSHFLPRTQDHKLRLVIDAFRFRNEETKQLYITCQLNAVPVNDAEAPNKACAFSDRRWRSADGNDYSCRYCQSQAGQTPSKAGPRGFGRPEEPEASWRSGLKTNNVWEQEARVGPVMVLPDETRTGPQPEEELHPGLHKVSRPVEYGSRWRSGVKDRAGELEKGQFPLSTPDLEEDEDEEQHQSQTELEVFPSPSSTPDQPEDAYEKNLDKSLFIGQSTPDPVQETADTSGADLKDLEEGLVPSPPPEPEEENDPVLKEEHTGYKIGATLGDPVQDVLQRAEDGELDNDTTGDMDVSPTSAVETEATSPVNVSATELNRSVTDDPKR